MTFKNLFVKRLFGWIVAGLLLSMAVELTGNLDSKTGAEVLGLIKRTSTEFHQTVVMITLQRSWQKKV